jgi:hypothetical protein
MSTNEDPNPLDSELQIEVKNTFEVDWKKFLTSLKEKLPKFSPFVQKVSQITHSSNSIANVIDQINEF